MGMLTSECLQGIGFATAKPHHSCQWENCSGNRDATRDGGYHKGNPERKTNLLGGN